MPFITNKISILLGFVGLLTCLFFCIKLQATPNPSSTSSSSLSINKFVETPVQGIKSFSILEDKIFFYSGSSSVYELIAKNLKVDAPIDVDATNRFIMPAKLANEQFGGVISELDQARILVWDNLGLNLTVTKRNAKEIIETKSIAIDLIKAPADPKGEPTKTETSMLRVKFLKHLSKVFGPKISSIRKITTQDKLTTHDVYIVGSRVSKFPVLLLKCEKDDPINCIMERACFIDERSTSISGDTFGVALNSQSNRLVIGDAELRKIHVFEWKSCFDSRYIYSLDLPTRLLKPTSLQIDYQNRLWVSTLVLDGFTNSSLFYWDRNEWNR